MLEFGQVSYCRNFDVLSRQSHPPKIEIYLLLSPSKPFVYSPFHLENCHTIQHYSALCDLPYASGSRTPAGVNIHVLEPPDIHPPVSNQVSVSCAACGL